MTTTTQPSQSTLTRWMLEQTSSFSGKLFFSAVFRVIFQLGDVALFGVAAYFLATIAPSTSTNSSLVTMAVSVVVICLVKAIARYGEQFLGHWVAFKSLELLRSYTFSRLWPQAPDVLYRRSSGDLLENLTKDIDRLEVFFAHTIVPAVTAVITPLLVVLGVGIWGSWFSALILLGALIIFLVVVPFTGLSATRRCAVDIAQTRADLTESVTDSVQGRTEIVGYGLEPSRLELTLRLDHSLVELTRRRQRVFALRKTLGWVLSLLGPLLVFLQHQDSLPVAIVTLVVAFRAFEPLREIEQLMPDLDSTYASAERIYRLTHGQPAVSEPDHSLPLPEGPLGFTLRNVTYTYPEDDLRGTALDDVSVAIPAGKHTVLMGHSGSGKTTLAHLLMRWDDPRAGSVSVTGGSSVSAYNLEDLRAAITYVAQEPFLFNMSVAENMRLACPEAKDDELWRVLRIAELEGFIQSLPAGLDTRVGELAKKFSGGQRSRLTLARALLRNPRVLILDEFTAALDTGLAARIYQNLKNEYGDTTIIEISHRPESRDMADEIIELDSGRVI